MPKCRVCGKEMQKTSEENYYCDNPKCKAKDIKFSLDDLAEGDLNEWNAGRSTKEKATDWFKGQKEKIETKVTEKVSQIPSKVSGKITHEVKGGLQSAGRWAKDQTREVRATFSDALKEGVLGAIAGPSTVFNIWLCLTIIFITIPAFLPTVDTLTYTMGSSVRLTPNYNQKIGPYFSRINEEWLSLNTWRLHMMLLFLIWPWVSLIQFFLLKMSETSAVPIGNNLFYQTASSTRTINRAILYFTLAMVSFWVLMQVFNKAIGYVYGVEYCPPEVPVCKQSEEQGSKTGSAYSLYIDTLDLEQSSVKCSSQTSSCEKLITGITLTNKNDKDGPTLENVRMKLIYNNTNEWEAKDICNNANLCNLEPQDSKEVQVQIDNPSLTLVGFSKWENKPLTVEVTYDMKAESIKQYYVYRADKDITVESPEHVRGPGPIDMKITFIPKTYPVRFEKGSESSIKNDATIVMKIRVLNTLSGEAKINKIDVVQNSGKEPKEQYLLKLIDCGDSPTTGNDESFSIDETIKLKRRISSEEFGEIYPGSQKLIQCEFKSPNDLTDRNTLTFYVSADYEYTEKKDTHTYVYSETQEV